MDFSDLTIHTAHAVRCLPEWSWDSRRNGWTGFHLWLVTDGHGRLLADPGGSFDLGPADAFILRMTDVYLAEHDPDRPLQVIGVHFTTTTQPPPLHRRMDEVGFLTGCCRRIVEAQEAGQHSEAVFWLQAALQVIATQDADEHARRDDDDIDTAIRAWCRRMLDEPAEDHRVDTEAADLGICPDQLTRRFKKLIGHGPREHLISTRISQARALLVGSDLPIHLIADRLGYSDQFYFSRQFRSRTGQRPSDLRR